MNTDYTMQELNIIAGVQAANELGDMVTLYRNIIEKNGSKQDRDAGWLFLLEAHDKWLMMARIVAQEAGMDD